MTSILVVDDRPVERDLLSTVLGYAGYEVREAADGEQALDAARSAPPDLIITDIVMPRMDGYTFVHEVRNDALLAAIPVVFCTATYGLEEGRRLAEACGVSEVLAKPCEPEEILRVVAAAMGSTPGPERPIDAQFHREHLLVLNNKLVQQVEDLEEAHTQVMAASRLKSEFVSNMNHEIRTPLNGVIGVAELLIDTDLSVEQLKYARCIRRAGADLLEVADHILDFSKIEAGRLELKEAPFTLRDLVHEAASRFTGPADAKGIHLRVSVDAGLPQTVLGDAAVVRQVLSHLLSNAVKFTDEGGVAVRVTDVAEPGPPRIRFEVADTGIGIGPWSLGGIFDSFSQVDGSTTREHGGTGLGLALSKQLVELLGGEIGVETSEGAGSTFWFALPPGSP
jgi:signal transduction histidine kinase